MDTKGVKSCFFDSDSREVRTLKSYFVLLITNCKESQTISNIFLTPPLYMYARRVRYNSHSGISN